MLTVTSLIRAAHAYGAATGLPDVTVSWRIFGDSKKLAALIDGADVQLRRAERAMGWLAANWPEGAERPGELVRWIEHARTLNEPGLPGAGKNAGDFPEGPR